MYAQYVYKAGSTKANVLADIVALLTGETNKANLSADCVQANTEILTTESVAGWTLHDGTAGTNRVILSAPCEDAAFTKYVGIDINTDDSFKFGGASTWDAGAHTGTKCIYTNNNPVALSSLLAGANFSLAAGGTIYIQASVRHIHLYCRVAAANALGFLVTEFSREGVNTSDTTYPNWGILQSNYAGFMPACKHTSSTGEANSSNGSQGYTGIAYTFPVMPQYIYSSGMPGQTAYYNTAEVSGFEAIPIDQLLLVGGYAGGITATINSAMSILGRGKAPGMVCKAGGNFDTMIVGGKTYIRITSNGILGGTVHPIWLLMG